MKNIIYILAGTMLAFGVLPAVASQSSPVFANADSHIRVAQAEAVDDYADYLHEMMMDDENMMPMLDANDDGEVSDEEFRDAYERAFKKFDRNDDGMIDEDEISASASQSG